MAATAVCRKRCAILLACFCSIATYAQSQEVTRAVLFQPEFEAYVGEELPDTPVLGNPGRVSQAYHLSLDEAKSRALQNSAIMDLASLQVTAKYHALQAARKDFLPKLLNSFSYFHFDSDLGSVLTTPGIFNPATTVAVPIIEQDATMYTAAAIQPITPLLKVREAVNIGVADVRTAEAQEDFARAEITKGVEQLYFGLLAAQRIRGGLQQAVAGARQMADASSSPDAHISLVEAQQNLLTADSQVLTLTEQLNALAGLPHRTTLELDSPSVPPVPFVCVDDAVASAVSSSPKVREAQLQVDKAEAAMRLAQADYVPSVNAYGFYVNQDSTPTIQEDFTGVGLSASYLLEWGKKNDTYRASRATVALARQNLRKEIDDLRLNAAKAYHEADRSEKALGFAQQLAKLNREVQLPTDPFQLKFAVKSRLEAELGAIKAEMDFRSAVTVLRSITGQLP